MRSAQGNLVWIKPSGSQSTAVAATSDQPMDVDTGHRTAQDRAIQLSRVPVTSPSILGSGVGSRSYIKPAQGNFLNEGSTRPDASLGKQHPNPMLNPGFNPGGVLGNKERAWYSMANTSKYMLSLTYLLRNVQFPIQDAQGSNSKSNTIIPLPVRVCMFVRVQVSFCVCV